MSRRYNTPNLPVSPWLQRWSRNYCEDPRLMNAVEVSSPSPSPSPSPSSSSTSTSFYRQQTSFDRDRNRRISCDVACQTSNSLLYLALAELANITLNNASDIKMEDDYNMTSTPLHKLNLDQLESLVDVKRYLMQQSFESGIEDVDDHTFNGDHKRANTVDKTWSDGNSFNNSHSEISKAPVKKVPYYKKSRLREDSVMDDDEYMALFRDDYTPVCRESTSNVGTRQRNIRRRISFEVGSPDYQSDEAKNDPKRRRSSATDWTEMGEELRKIADNFSRSSTLDNLRRAASNERRHSLPNVFDFQPTSR